MMGKTCEHCGQLVSGYRTSRRRFCDDKCRVAWHRAKKATPKKVLQEKAEKFDSLVREIKTSITRNEKLAIRAMEKSKEDRPTIERVNFIAMSREKEELVKELKFLLELSEQSYEDRIAAIYAVDPIHYD